MESFIEALYSDKPDDAFILLWEGKTKRSFWTRDTIDAIKIAKEHNDDIYIGTGLSPRDYGPSKRCLAKNIIGIPGLWADIDVKHPVHKKQKLPETYDDAQSLIKGKGFDPSIIVDSGHGIQAWWLWKEIWSLGSMPERSAAEILLAKLNAHLTLEAKKHDWEVDSVHDLSRVLRIPGTQNCKNGKSKQVKILSINENIRYNPEDIEKFLPDNYHVNSKPKSVLKRETIVINSKELVFDQNAAPEFDDFLDLQTVFDPEFTNTWNNQRHDLEDSSPSSFDYSLAIFAAKAKWSKQSTLNLLIAHRRKNGHNLKFDNKQYYIRTIINARAFVKNTDPETDKAEAEADMISETLREAKQRLLSTPPGESKPSVLVIDKDSREQVLTTLRSRLGIPIIRFKRYMMETPIYAIVLQNNTEITIGSSNTLLSFRLVKAKIADSTNLLIKTVKAKEWDKTIQNLLNIVEDVFISEESTTAGEISWIITDYLSDKPKIGIDDAVDGKEPFVKDGLWYIFLEKLYLFAKMQHGVEIGKKDFGMIMKKIGCKCEKIDITLNDLRTSRSVWKIRI